jgi:hypothetical protein
VKCRLLRILRAGVEISIIAAIAKTWLSYMTMASFFSEENSLGGYAGKPEPLVFNFVYF